MKDARLKIVINKPVSEVFVFTTDPKNTSKWIDFIEVEETNEWPAKVGTIYRNKGRGSGWTEYEVTKFKENEVFIFAKKGSTYHVQYTFKDLGNKKTELEYYEWVEEGVLDEPFSLEILQKLKAVMERQ